MLQDDLLYLVNGRVLTPARIIVPGMVGIKGGIIMSVGWDGDPVPEGARKLDVGGRVIAPGLIDLHVHGGGGSDVMDATPGSFAEIARTHAAGGTTSFLPTTLTSSAKDLHGVLEAYREAAGLDCQGAAMLGMHLEGPYFSPSEKGAQDIRFIKDPDPVEYRMLLETYPFIARWSVAPELPGALDMGRTLRRYGILASAAHTAACEDQMLAAIDAGFTHLTHFYSAMSGVRRINARRIAGVVETGLLRDDVSVEIIADGVHLPPSLLKLIYRSKGAGQIALVTDAMRAAGMPEGEYILGGLQDGQRVLVEDGAAQLPDRSALAGSVATGATLIRNIIRLAEVPLSEAVRMASTTPARILGLHHRKGRLDPGMDADITVFDDHVNVALTIVSGNIVFDRLSKRTIPAEQGRS